jgi:hypothetical protein
MRGSRLARLIDLAVQIEDDTHRAPEALRRRDRALGRELLERFPDPERRVAAWLDRVRPEGGPTIGERAERSYTAARVVLGGLGLLMGSGTAAALFHYDGTHPVNVVRVMAVFVGLHAITLAATLIAMLPRRWRRGIPGLTGLQDALQVLAPGRWGAALIRLLPAARREASARVAGMVRRHRRLYGDVERWWLLTASQGFAVAFHASAITTALGLVAFTDLAFAWSTTLDLDPRRFTRLSLALALPWSRLWPEAVPTADLVTATQYFRASHVHTPGTSSPWWRFLLACMLVYGLLPRVALLILARWRLSRALSRAFARLPGVAALRDRLESRLVETVAERAEPAVPRETDGEGLAQGAPLAEGAACHVLAWSGFPLADAAAASADLGVAAVSLVRAGEGAVERDTEALRALAATRDAVPVLFVVKSWEPPVHELLDFLAELRAALGGGRAILVAPLALDASGRPAAPAARDAAQWRRALDRLGDPWTSVHATPRREAV